MNRPCLFIGDMQNTKQPVLFIAALRKQFPDHHYVFVGDFLDSWVSKPVYQVKALKFALTLVEAEQADVVWSNHDIRYAYKELGETYCTGFHTETAMMVTMGPLAERMRKLIKPYLLCEEFGVLVTHAGISARLANLIGQDITPALLDVWFADRESPYYWAGPGRMGLDPIGGPLWCDWNTEFDPIEGVTQIVGHTRQKSIAHKWLPGGAQAYNVDCLGSCNTVLELTLDGAFKQREVTL